MCIQVIFDLSPANKMLIALGNTFYFKNVL